MKRLIALAAAAVLFITLGAACTPEQIVEGCAYVFPTAEGAADCVELLSTPVTVEPAP